MSWWTVTKSTTTGIRAKAVRQSPLYPPHEAVRDPKAVRTYNAIELSITRRFAFRWLGSASYALQPAQR